MGRHVRAEAIRRAVEMLGGEKQLAERLGFSVTTVRMWIDSKLDVPEAIFLQVVDIIDARPADPDPNARV